MTVALKTRHRFQVEDFHRLVETGILGPEERVELVEGELIDMTPIGSGHAGAVTYLAHQIRRALEDRALVQSQSPLRLGELSEPQPDLTVLQPRADYYRESHPTAEDVLLLIEVAQTSLAYDREVKIPLYARHGIPQVWLVDLATGVVVDYREPAPDGFRFTRVLQPGDALQAARLPELELPVADVLG